MATCYNKLIARHFNSSKSDGSLHHVECGSYLSCYLSALRALLQRCQCILELKLVSHLKEISVTPRSACQDFGRVVHVISNLTPSVHSGVLVI
jgi:hypothetical protein